MLRFVLSEAGRLLLGLFGAVLIAAAIDAMALPHAADGPLPFVVGWGARLSEFAHLRFGQSAISGMPAIREVASRLPLTLGLVFDGVVVAIVVGIPIGFLFGAGPVRRAAAPLVQVVAAAPIFCAGLALTFVAVNLLHWPVHSIGGGSSGAEFFPRELEQLRALALPAITIGLAGAATVQLAIRRAAAELGHESWRLYLRRMGLAQWEIDTGYVMPQIFAALISSLGDVILSLLSAAAVAEWVFSCPGAADLFVRSVALHDWTLVGAVLFVFAGLTMSAQFVGRCAALLIADPGRAT